MLPGLTVRARVVAASRAMTAYRDWGLGGRDWGRKEKKMAEQIRNYKDLRVWQEAMKLVAMTYGVAKRLPASERFGMVPQMNRAAVSIPANIAEGHGSSHRPVFLNHLSISKGSLMELETYLILAVQLRFQNPDQTQEAQTQLQLVAKLLNALIRALRPPRPRTPLPTPQPPSPIP